MRIGWIGVGLMGSPMCQRVLAAGHRVSVLRRRPDAVSPLVQMGAISVDDLAGLVADSEVLVTVLPAPAEVRDIYLGEGGLLARTLPGTVCVDMTTSSPALARELASEGEQRSVTVIDAPVSGGPFGAERGTLSAMVGGKNDAVAQVQPLLECMCTRIIHHGPSGAGQVAKLVNQILVAGTTQATCEAFALANAAGLNPEKVQESINSGAAGSALFDFLWSKLAAHDCAPGFKLSHLLKDLSLVVEEATQHNGLDLAVTDHIRTLTQAAQAVLQGQPGTQALIETVVPGRFP